MYIVVVICIFLCAPLRLFVKCNTALKVNARITTPNDRSTQLDGLQIKCVFFVWLRVLF